MNGIKYFTVDKFMNSKHVIQNEGPKRLVTIAVVTSDWSRRRLAIYLSSLSSFLENSASSPPLSVLPESPPDP